MTLDADGVGSGYSGRPADVRRAVSAQLAAAGVPTPDADAGWLVAAAAGTTPAALVAVESLDDEQRRVLARWVRRRVQREPLQHILGTAAFRYLTLQVGPGVFVPRPESEVLVDVAMARLSAIRSNADHPDHNEQAPRPVVVDLCAGSGAIALAMATECRGIDVWAVELHTAARDWLQRNVAAHSEQLAARASTCRVVAADATADPLPELTERVDVVTCNPPYIPEQAVPRDPEVAKFDPAPALYGGPDGLDVVRGVINSAAGLLRPGGWLLIEHGDAQGWQPGGVPPLLAAHGAFVDVSDLPDLAGRPRVSVARRQ